MQVWLCKTKLKPVEFIGRSGRFALRLMWRISPDNGLSVWQTHVHMVEHLKSSTLFSCEVYPGSLDSISGVAHPARTCPGLNFYPEGKHKQTISQHDDSAFFEIPLSHSQEVCHRSCAPNGVLWRTTRPPSSSTPNRSWRGSNISMTTKLSTETSRWEEQRLGVSVYGMIWPWIYETRQESLLSLTVLGFYFMCALGRQRLDQHLQRSLEDLRLWDLQAFSRNQSLHRDIRWSGNGSKHILILLSFKFQTKLECLAFSVVFNRNSSVHGPRDYRPGASGLWEAGWYLVSGVHHHRNGDGQNAVPRAGKSSGRHVQGTSGENLEMNTIQGTFLILQKWKWKCDMANLCLLLSYRVFIVPWVPSCGRKGLGYFAFSRNTCDSWR